MTDIAIIGAGISGLTLALTLQRRGVDCTVHADRTSDEMRRGRLPNTVVRYRRDPPPGTGAGRQPLGRCRTRTAAHLLPR